MRRRWDTLIGLVLILMLLAVQVIDFRREMARLAQAETALRLHGACQGLTRLKEWVAERSDGVSALTETLEMMPEDRIGQSLNHLATLDADVGTTYVGFADGSWAVPGQWSAPEGYRVSERPWFTAAIHQSGVAVTLPYQDYRVNRKVVAFSKSFVTRNGTRAVVANVIPTARLEELLRIDQRDYAATLRSRTTTIAAFVKGDGRKLSETTSLSVKNGWIASYRISRLPDARQLMLLVFYGLFRWVLEVVAVLFVWAFATRMAIGKAKDAVRSLNSVSELQVPVTLPDLSPTVISLSRDVAAFPEVLLQMLALKDNYTAQHARNVAALAVGMGQRLGLPSECIAELNFAGILHDIGKVGISEQLLHKPGRLTEEEWIEMRKHPGLGSKLVGKAGIKKTIAEAIRDHHERLDGSGYPSGCTEAHIGLLARIIAAADVYDAMTSDRPYRKALPPAEAFAYLNNGGVFDQEVVGALRTVVDEETVVARKPTVVDMPHPRIGEIRSDHDAARAELVASEELEAVAP